MIFFNDRQPDSTVTSKGKRIAHFIDGEFETENPILIEKLKKHFRFGDGNKVKAKVLSYWELKLKAEALGIKTHKMKRKDIEKALLLKK